MRFTQVHSATKWKTPNHPMLKPTLHLDPSPVSLTPNAFLLLIYFPKVTTLEALIL